MKRNFLVREQIKRFSRPPLLASLPAISQHPYYSRQRKIVLRNCGYLDPESLEEYIARGGYHALQRVFGVLDPSASDR